MPEITKKKKEEILLFQKKKRISKTPQNAILPYNAKSKKQTKKSKSEEVKKTLNSTLTKQTCSFGFCLISGDSHWCSCLLGATGRLYWQRTHKEDSAKNKEKKPNESKSDIDLKKKEEARFNNRSVKGRLRLIGAGRSHMKCLRTMSEAWQNKHKEKTHSEWSLQRLF